jgi:hypothetical protein
MPSGQPSSVEEGAPWRPSGATTGPGCTGLRFWFAGARRRLSWRLRDAHLGRQAAFPATSRRASASPKKVRSETNQAADNQRQCPPRTTLYRDPCVGAPLGNAGAGKCSRKTQDACRPISGQVCILKVCKTFIRANLAIRQRTRRQQNRYEPSTISCAQAKLLDRERDLLAHVAAFLCLRSTREARQKERTSPNSLVDHVAPTIAWAKLLGVEPYGHTVVLQFRTEPPDLFQILSNVGDEHASRLIGSSGCAIAHRDRLSVDERIGLFATNQLDMGARTKHQFD